MMCLLTVSVLLLSGQASAPKGGLEKSLKTALALKDFTGLRRLSLQAIRGGKPEDIRLAIVYGLQCDDYETELEIGGELAGLEADAARRVVVEQALKNPSFQVRLILVAVLGRYGDFPSLQALIAALRDPSPPVVMSAIAQLRRLRDARSIEPLIRLMEAQRQGGILHSDARKALRDLTGQSFDDPADWRNWWEPRKATFDPKSAEARQQPPGKTYVRGLKIWGIEIPSNKILFILDTSGSMRWSMDGKPPESTPLSEQRLRNVQDELIRVIKLLPPTAQFNIMTFNSRITMFRERLVAPPSGTKLKAIQFVQSMKAEGETYTDEAFREAFKQRHTFDTIYFLSDGAPRRNNKLLPQAPLLNEIRRANRFTKVKIHTIGFRAAGTNVRGFMQRLAFENDGEYRELPLLEEAGSPRQ